MRLLEMKKALAASSTMAFQLPNGAFVPNHFHVTEVGKITKSFIDCGGTLRNEEVVNLQLWNATDYDHRLHPEKLLGIIELAEEKLALGDWEIEVEYQGETIQKFGLAFKNNAFQLTGKQTDCLALEACGTDGNILKEQVKKVVSSNSCAPGSGCC